MARFKNSILLLLLGLLIFSSAEGATFVQDSDEDHWVESIEVRKSNEDHIASFDFHAGAALLCPLIISFRNEYHVSIFIPNKQTLHFSKRLFLLYSALVFYH
ncbi:MAG TPA: hypothetical protein ENJ82_02125 [Bacteroidetes bacterium]|nr:hypothetical protein [Bacteroidota bacterium]